MPRIYKRTADVPQVLLPDWDLLREIEVLFEQFRNDVAVQCNFEATDSRGKTRASGLDAFKVELEGHAERPTQVLMSLQDYSGDDSLHLQTWMSDTSYHRGTSLSSVREEVVDHVLIRLGDLYKRAHERWRAETRVASTHRLRRFAYDPWVIAIGSLLAAAVIIAVVAALTH